MPASASRVQASVTSGVSSAGWVKCRLIHSGWCFFRILVSERVTRMRQHHRHLGAEAHELDMADGAQPAEQIVEPLVGQRQRIAAGDQHVADLGMRRDIVERLLPLRAAEGIVAAGLADHARARAVAAIGRAEAGGQEQHAVGIAVHETRRGGMAVLAERIVGLARRLQIFGADRDMRAPQRLERILAAHQARVIRRDAERQRSLVAHHGVALVVGQHEERSSSASVRMRLRACQRQSFHSVASTSG